MPISVTNVSFHKSLSTNAGTESLGGGLGASLASQATSQPLVVTGVYISQAFGNALGGASLAYNPTTQTFAWRAQGSSETSMSVPVVGNGQYVVGTPASGMVVVTVNYALLPTTYKVETIDVTAPTHTVFSQTTALMALVGDVQYRCLYFRNNHPTLTASDVRLYLHAPPALPQTIAIGVDPAGVGDGVSSGVAQTIATASTPPVGVAFTMPVQASSGIPLGTLAPNTSVAFWQRRTVPAMAYGPMSMISATIGVALVG